MGTGSVEVWNDTGANDFPLERISGAFNEIGCLSPYSIAKLDNGIFWLGSDPRGRGIVYRANGYTGIRVSTHAVEWQIQSHSRIDDAIAYAYQKDGHPFYVLTFPTANKTWVFDVSTGLWHERASGNQNQYRHRSNCFVSFNDELVVGDFQNGKLYAFDSEVYTDDGQIQKWERSWRALPPGSNDLNRSTQHRLQIDMETGVGLSGGAEDPTPILLDTFTAANGTDPTSRDVNNYPALAGANRWQVRDVGFVAGEIVSNSLRTTSVVDQVSLVIKADSNAVLADFSGGVTLVFWADALADGFCRLWLENLSQNDGIKLALNGEDLDALIYGEVSGTYPDWEPAAGLAVGPGLKKIAVHIGADNVGYLLVNGAEIASQSLITSGPWINQNWVTLRADVETNTSAYISRAALYQGLTLAQATALTA
jgi:hypothetical protein